MWSEYIISMREYVKQKTMKVRQAFNMRNRAKEQ